MLGQEHLLQCFPVFLGIPVQISIPVQEWRIVGFTGFFILGNQKLICIDFPKKFLGTTVVRRDAGMFNFLQRWATSLQRVALPDARLEKAFEVYSSDQVEARYLIHPVFMERLLDMEAHFRGEKLRCAFYKGKLLIAIDGGDKFEIGSMFRTLLNEDRVRGVLKDLAEIMKVIEAVLTAETSYLPS